jgi:hypothetical protein
LGLALALLLFSPNLVWQAQHDWATVAFMREISAGMLARIPRVLFVLGQVLYMGPFAAVVWGVGLFHCFSSAGREVRVFGCIFVTVLAALLITQAKPYYLAPAYPALFAVGGVRLEQFVGRRPWLRRSLLSTIALGAVFGVWISLPFTSLPDTDRRLDALFGSVVPAMALTHDLHDEYGWRQQAQVVARVHQALSAEDRRAVWVLTDNYGQASAINFFGADLGLPRAHSGHMTYYLWGPGQPEPRAVIAYGLPRQALEALFADVREVDRIAHPLAPPKESGLAVYVCRRFRAPLDQVWPRLKRYVHGERGQARAQR